MSQFFQTLWARKVRLFFTYICWTTFALAIVDNQQRPLTLLFLTLAIISTTWAATPTEAKQ